MERAQRKDAHTGEGIVPTEDALRRLQAISETSGDAIIVKGLDNIIESWSRGAERTYGYRAEETVGRSITMLMPPERVHEASEIVARVSKGERVENLETIRVAKDGRQLLVNLSVSPVYGEAGRVTGALSIVQDITARREAEAQLRVLQAEREALEAEHRERALLLEAANRVALDVLASRTGLEALRHIAEAARTLTGAQYAALGVTRPGSGTGRQSQFCDLVLVGPRTEAPDEAFHESLPGPRADAPGVMQLLLERSVPLRLVMLDQSGEGETFLGVPVRRGGPEGNNETLGALYLTGKPKEFSAADESAVVALSAHAAVAIHHWRVLDDSRALTRRLLSAQEAERRAVAFDLHDGLTQYIMAAQLRLEALRAAREDGREDKVTNELNYLSRLVDEAVLESRRMVNGLRLLHLDALGLSGALEQLLNEEAARVGWHTEFQSEVGERRFDLDLETGIYRVAQEALSNTRKHAGAQHVTVQLSGSDRTLILCVRDDGQGFVPDERRGISDRVGLGSMAERVNLLNGTFHLDSAPGVGTTITATFPIAESSACDTP